MELDPDQQDVLRFLDFEEPESAASMPEAGRRFGDFMILREIGSGGGGVVFEAIQVSLDRRIALKVMPMTAAELRGSSSSRRQREALMLAKLKHANIVNIFDSGSVSGFRWVSMELIDGYSLAEVLVGKANEFPKPNEDGWLAFIVPLLHQIASALASAHKQSIIHRDVKPANVLLSKSGQAYLADFGLARLEQSDDPTLTQGFCGTPRYASPEQAKQQPLTVASDVFSFGSLAFEVLNRRPAFEGTTNEEVLHAVQFSDPTWIRPASIPRDLRAIVDKCLEKGIHDSYSSAEEVKDELARFLRFAPVHANPIGRWRRTVRRIKRQPGKAMANAFMLALVLVAGGAGIIALQEGGSAKRLQAHADYLHALQLFHLGQWDSLYPKLKEGVNNNGQDRQFLSLAADTFLLDEDPASAANYYADALVQDPDNYYDKLGLAIADFESGQHKLPHFDKLPEINSAREGLLQGLYLHAANRDQIAHEPLTLALQWEPLSFPTLVTQAQALSRAGLHTKAIDSLQTALAVYPKSFPQAQFLMTELRLMQRFEEAERLARQMMNFYPDAPKAAAELAFSLLMRERPEEAERHARRAVKLDANLEFPWVSNVLAFTLEVKGKYEEEEKLLKQALEVNPSAEILWLRQGWLDFRRGQLDSALSFATRLQQSVIPRSRNDGLDLQCQIYKSQGRNQDALGGYLELANRDSGTVRWPWEAGHLLLNMGKQDAAENWIAKALQLTPDDSQILLLHCRVQSEQGEFHGALDDALHALGLNPRNSLAAYWAALCWLDLENPEAGIIFAKKATILSPSWVDGWIVLALLEHELGRKEDSVLSYRRALEIKDLPGVHADVADLLDELGDDQGSLVEYRLALKGNPNHLSALSGACILHLRSEEAGIHDVAKAKAFIERALKLAPKHEAYLELLQEVQAASVTR